MSALRVRYFGSFGHRSGYAQATHDYLLALHRAGVDVNIRPIIDTDPSWLPERYAELVPLANRTDNGADEPGWPTHIIVHTIPLGLDIFVTDALTPPTGVKRIALTTWETSRVPDRAVGLVRQHFDQLWVPSTYNADAFMSGGCAEESVKVVPHCFDPDVWWPGGWKPTRTAHEVARGVRGATYEPYIFYGILTFCERKNPIGLLKAYLTTFGPQDNVILRIKTPGFNEDEVEQLARGLKLDYLPPVDMVCGHVSEAELRQLHIDSDCYVTAARAEGWGLGAFEAILMGNPVIAPKYGGLREFMDDAEGVVKYPYQLTPAYTPETLSNQTITAAGLTIRPVNHNDHLGIRGDQEWAEPDLHALKWNMRAAYDERWGKTDRNMARFAERFSYAAVGQLMVKLLEAL